MEVYHIHAINVVIVKESEMTENLDSMTLQKAEISSKVVHEYLKTLLEYAMENRLAFISLEDIKRVKQIKFDFPITDELIITNEQLDNVIKKTILIVLKSIIMVCSDYKVDRLHISFLEYAYKNYDWKKMFKDQQMS